MIIGLALVSVVLIFLHIRMVRPDAWRDAFEQLKFRLSADPGKTARFGTRVTAAEWFLRQGEFLSRGILIPFWLMAIAGSVCCWRKRRTCPGLARLGLLTSMLFSTAVLYLVMCRNVAYSHGYAIFYLLLPVALMSGVALEAALEWWEARAGAQWVRHAGLATAVTSLAVMCALGYLQSRAYHSRYYILEWESSEAEDLIPSLGRAIGERFAANGHVLCNFPWQSQQLQYYAQRVIVFEKITYADWQPLISSPKTAGGIIWLGAAEAERLLDALPEGEREIVAFGTHTFCFWKAASTLCRELYP
jgi:hypothetical protein